MRFPKRWFSLGVLVALVVALVVPAASVSAAGNATTLYLTKHEKKYLLTEKTPDHKGARNVEADRIYPAKSSATVYQVLGTWNSVPMTEISRIVNLGEANLWLSVTDITGNHDNDKNDNNRNDNNRNDNNRKNDDKPQQVSIQVQVEVLQNGNVMAYRESDPVILQLKGSGPTIIDLPAPRPAIELAVGDVYSLRVSVRDSGLNTAMKSYKVSLDYDGTKAPSNFSLETSTAPPVAAGGLITVGDVANPSFIDATGRMYITPMTPISFFIDVDIDMSRTTVTISSLSTGVLFYPASQGNNVIRFQNFNFDDYTVRIDAVTYSGQIRSDLIEVTLVPVLP